MQKKTSDKIQHTFMIKNSQKTRSKREFPQPDKDHLQKSTTDTLNGERLHACPLILVTRQGCVWYHHSFHHHTGKSNQCSKTRKRNKRRWKGKLERLEKNKTFIINNNNLQTWLRRKLLKNLHKWIWQGVRIQGQNTKINRISRY